MAMNYTDLIAAKTNTGSVKYWINYDPVPVEAVIEDAEAFIYSRLRVREMRASTTLSLASGDSTEALPTGFLDPISMVDKNPGTPIVQVEEGRLLELRSYDETTGLMTSGVPGRYAIFDEVFNFDVRADAARSLVLVYYKRPTALGASNATNWLTTRYPNLLRAAILAHAADFRQDDGNYKRWMERAAALITAANAESDLSRRGTNEGE